MKKLFVISMLLLASIQMFGQVGYYSASVNMNGVKTYVSITTYGNHASVDVSTSKSYGGSLTPIGYRRTKKDRNDFKVRETKRLETQPLYSGENFNKKYNEPTTDSTRLSEKNNLKTLEELETNYEERFKKFRK